MTGGDFVYNHETYYMERSSLKVSGGGVSDMEIILRLSSILRCRSTNFCQSMASFFAAIGSHRNFPKLASAISK